MRRPGSGGKRSIGSLSEAAKTPVIMVAKANPKAITSLEDLVKPDVKLALPDQDQSNELEHLCYNIPERLWYECEKGEIRA
ncbi:MAG: hypothetical protein H0Z39_11405 [Peptococcaceae bacterium]|nr:hypothetical protein [Peptococcaceae bacterium]